MPSARRTIARVLSALVLVAAGYAVSVLVKVREPFPADVYGISSPVDQALARARGNCEENNRATGLVRWSRGDAGETLRRACAGLPAVSVTESDPPVVAVDRAHYSMRLRIQTRLQTATMFLVGLALAAIFAVAGFGRIAAILAVVSLAVPCLGGVYEAIPVGLVAALVFLGAAPFGIEANAAPPRDASSAALVAALLVPPGAAAMLAMGFAEISYHLEKRLAYTTTIAAAAWIVAGVPLTILIHRARRNAARDPALAAPLRIGFARFVLTGLIFATSVAYYGAFRRP
jgi:hypothetical protein